jgi:hypothetical protein
MRSDIISIAIGWSTFLIQSSCLVVAEEFERSSSLLKTLFVLVSELLTHETITRIPTPDRMFVSRQ